MTQLNQARVAEHLELSTLLEALKSLPVPGNEGECVERIAWCEDAKAVVAALQVCATHKFEALRLASEKARGVPESQRGKSIGSEVGLAKRQSPSQGARDVAAAKALVEDMPAALGALFEGEISERSATSVADAAASLAPEARRIVDESMSGRYGALTPMRLKNEVRALADQIDAAGIGERHARAARNRRVWLRTENDGMATLSALLPMLDASACLSALSAAASSAAARGQARGRSDGQLAADIFADRLTGRGAWRGNDTSEPQEGSTGGAARNDPNDHTGGTSTDSYHTSCENEQNCGRSGSDEDRESGACHGTDNHHTSCENEQNCGSKASPDGAADKCAGCGGVVAEIQIQITDTALFGINRYEYMRAMLSESKAKNTESNPFEETAWIAGHGPIPATLLRQWLTQDRRGIYYRRIFLDPITRNLAAMDSKRRGFGGVIRKALIARDDRCRTPGCGAPIRNADHATPVKDGGTTTWDNALGLCARCNQVKETPGWVTNLSEGEVEITTPTGHTYRSSAPQLPALRQSE